MAEMSEDQFIELVKKAEREAGENIGMYKTKLALFAVLGYVVIFSIIVCLVVLVGGTLATAFISSTLFILLLKKKLIIIILPAIWVMLKALWVKFDTPTGYLLTRDKYPELWSEVDALSKKLKSQPIHQIILTPELNASISQTPRLGVLGWQLNTLTLGLELLLIASADELRSVIGHELGHLSGNHSKFNGWIYRVRLSWHRLMNAFHESDSFGARIMASFFNWYSPKFDAYSFALARNNEYEADAIAVELTSPTIATSALVNVYASSPFIDERYWDTFYGKADQLPEPDHAPYEGLVNFLENNPLSKDEMIGKIKDAMSEKTYYDDTHPSLKDRVDAIGAEPVLPRFVKISAAHTWLGKNLKQVLSDFDAEWYENNKERWRERYDYVTESNAKLDELSKSEMTELSDEDLWQFGMLNLEFRSDDEALPVFNAYKSRHKDDVDASYMIGQILYRKDDEACLDYFKEAITRESLIINSCEYAYYYLINHDREKEALEWNDIRNRQIDIQDAAQAERSSASVDDEYMLPELSDEIIDVLKQVKGHKNVRKVWIAQKRLKYYPESPVYVIVFSAKGFYTSYESVQAKVTESIQTNEDVFVVVKAGDFKKLAKKVIKAGEIFNG